MGALAIDNELRTQPSKGESVDEEGVESRKWEERRCGEGSSSSNSPNIRRIRDETGEAHESQGPKAQEKAPGAMRT